jgi:hypothetical protein
VTIRVIGDELILSVVDFLPPIRIQAVHSGDTIRTRLVRLFCPRRRRSWTVTRLSWQIAIRLERGSPLAQMLAARANTRIVSAVLGALNYLLT